MIYVQARVGSPRILLVWRGACGCGGNMFRVGTNPYNTGTFGWRGRVGRGM